MIEGRADIYLFDEKGEIIDLVRLGAPGTVGEDKASRSFMYRLSKPIYHLVIPRSEWTIYHEVLTGPWSKNEVVQYAPFAPPENDRDCILKFIKQVTGLTLDGLIK